MLADSVLCVFGSLSCQEDDKAAEGDVGVDDIGEDLAGDALVGPVAGCHSYHQTGQSVEVRRTHCRGNVAAEGAYGKHGDVGHYRVCLDHAHVVVLVRLRRNKVKDNRRTVHAEKSAHDAADQPRAELPASGRTDDLLEFLFEEAEVQAYDYQHDTENHPHGPAFDLIQQKYRQSREDDERSHHRQKPLPCDELEVFHHHDRS